MGDGRLELQPKFEEIQRGMELRTLTIWCSKIESDAKIRCPSYDIRLKIKIIGKRRFDIRINADKEATQCIIDVIKLNLPRMPITTRRIFEALIINMKVECPDMIIKRSIILE